MKKFRNLLFLLAVVVAIAGVFWFANRFGGGEKVESEKPTVVCKKENECFWTAHINATIKMFKDGK